MKRMILFLAGSVFFFSGGRSQVVTDYDGNSYDTVVIGAKTWLKENLRVTHYRNGAAIPNVAAPLTWANLTSGARCYYNNDSAAMDSVYGPLYNWYAVIDANGLCPSGWHVCSNAEWQAAESYLGGVMVAGGKMKETGTTHWLSPNSGATNTTGFTGLPGGMRDPNSNSYRYMFENGLWWTTTQYNVDAAWSTYLYYLNAAVDHNPTPKTLGMSVRCVLDDVTGLDDRHSESEIRVYPNPSSGPVTVCCSENGTLLQGYDLTGMRVLEVTLPEGTTRFSFRHLPEGLYLLKITGEQGTTWQKLVIKP